MRVALVGPGTVGRRVVGHLASDPAVTSVVVVHRDPMRLAWLVDDLDPRVSFRKATTTQVPEADVVVVTLARGGAAVAEAALRAGAHVVSAADDPAEVRALLTLDPLARRAGRVVVTGAAMAPGLTCVLARQAAAGLDRVDEVHVASLGTGGPACARQHHASFSLVAQDWDDGAWRRRPGGSGRELVWFPEPVGGADCYRAGLADALLLAPAFPGVRRVTARRHATRRDRVTAWMPMLRRPHPEGLIGAARVEVRGWRGGLAETRIIGSVAPPAAAAAAVAAIATRWSVEGRFGRDGAAGLGELVERSGPFLRDLAALGVTGEVFEGRPGS